MDRNRSWKVYDKPAARVYRDAIRSSINPTGEITFDMRTYRKMGEPQAMVLMYERSTETIGLKPSNPNEPNAVLVRVRHARSNRVIRSAPFLKENGIEVPTTLRFADPYIEDGILVLDMRTTVTWGKGQWVTAKRRDERKAAAAEARADRERRRLDARAERERLKAERHELSLERARVAAQERELQRKDRDRQREYAKVKRDLEKRLRRAMDE